MLDMKMMLLQKIVIVRMKWKTKVRMIVNEKTMASLMIRKIYSAIVIQIGPSNLTKPLFQNQKMMRMILQKRNKETTLGN